MDDLEILIPLTAIIFGGLTVLIPIAGITARIALKPVMEAFARYKEVAGEKEALALMERRMALLEEQIHGMDRSIRDLVEEAEFHRKLETGSAPRALPAEREPLSDAVRVARGPAEVER